MLCIDIAAVVLSCHIGHGDGDGSEDDGGNAACRGDDLRMMTVMMIMNGCLDVFWRYS